MAKAEISLSYWEFRLFLINQLLKMGYFFQKNKILFTLVFIRCAFRRNSSARAIRKTTFLQLHSPVKNAKLKLHFLPEENLCRITVTHTNAD